MRGSARRHGTALVYCSRTPGQVDPTTRTASEGLVQSFLLERAILQGASEDLLRSGRAQEGDEEVLVEAVELPGIDPKPGDSFDDAGKSKTVVRVDRIPWRGGTRGYHFLVRGET